MRESIATVKNYKDGSVTEYIKQKPDDVTLQGKTTIQLFDENGDMIKEMESENIVYSTYSRYAYYEYFQSYLYGNNRNSPGDFAQHIFLLNDSTPERDTRWWFGNQAYLARCKTRSAEVGGTSVGTLNVGESFSRQEYKDDGSFCYRWHNVYDFATNSANGTFNKLVHGYEETALVNAFTMAWKYSPVTVLQSHDASSYSGSDYFVISTADDSDDAYYVGVQSMTSTDSEYLKLHLIKMNYKTGYVGEIKDIPMKLKMSGKTLVGVSGVGYQDKLYLTMEGYTTTLWVVDLKTRTYEEKTDLTNNTTGALYHGGFVKDGFLYVHLYRGACRKIDLSTGEIVGVSSYTCTVGNEAFNIYGIFPTDVPNTYTVALSSYVVRATLEGTVFKSDVSRRKTRSIDKPYSLSGERQLSQSYLFNTSTKVVTSRPYIYDVYAPVIAENLLPEPITKTSVNTMKIQYDFVIEGATIRD